jgi:tRNA:m(5)U-54 methyltransferase
MLPSTASRKPDGGLQSRGFPESSEVSDRTGSPPDPEPEDADFCALARFIGTPISVPAFFSRLSSQERLSFFAGQICGVEGYVESIATGLLAGINASRLAQDREPLSPPRATACGSLVHYISNDSIENFQPVNITFGLLSEGVDGLRSQIRDRKERRRIQVEEALRTMDCWIRLLEK